MDVRDPDKAWVDQPDPCVLVLDNARTHDAVALSVLRDEGVFVLLLQHCSPYFFPIEDIFSVGSSWLRRWSPPAQQNAWKSLTSDTMLSYVTGGMCERSLRAAVRRSVFFLPCLDLRAGTLCPYVPSAHRVSTTNSR